MAGLDRGNRWTALVRLAPPTTGPLTDVLTGNGPWYHVSSDGNFGELVFKDKAAILSGDVQVTPGRDEFGARITNNMNVWIDGGCARDTGYGVAYWNSKSGPETGPVFRMGDTGSSVSTTITYAAMRRRTCSVWSSEPDGSFATQKRSSNWRDWPVSSGSAVAGKSGPATT